MFPQRRDLRLADAGARNNSGIKPRLCQTNHPLCVMLNLPLVLIFFSHRFNLTGGARHIIHRIHHRFVVIRDREITLRFRDIKTGVQPAAVKDRNGETDRSGAGRPVAKTPSG